MQGNQEKAESPFTTVNRYPMPVGFNTRGRAAFYRWFSGRPMNGHRYTNATALRYGTRSLDVSGHASQYQLLPGYLRFLYVRLPIMLILPYALASLAWPMVMYYLTLMLVLVATWRIQRWRKTAAFRRDVIEPVSAGVSAVLHTARAVGQGHTTVAIPENFRDDPDAKIKVQLPLSWIGLDGDKAALLRVVAAKLAIEELSPMWSLHGATPSVTFHKPPAPPEMVSFFASQADADAMSEDCLMCGYGPRKKIETFSLLLESPHMLLNGGSGSGKSVLTAWLVAQFMRKGFGVMVLDAKFVSHLWLNRIPGVHYASEAKDMHEALVWLDGELLRRARLVQAAADTDAASASLIPLVVVLEEITAGSGRLRSYWKSIKTKEDPAQSPALTALANLANMGRELRVHVILVGQSVTAKVTGGPEGRESFGGRFLARATANAWRMLAPQIKPAPLKRGAPGRWHLVVGDTLKEFQVPFLDLKSSLAMADVAAWAQENGTVPDVTAMVAGFEPTTTTGSVENPSSEAVEAVSLRDYCLARGIDLGKIREAKRSRTTTWPQEVRTGPNRTALYTWEDLDAFVSEWLREPADG
jgi:hypothetical protein